jgi:RimJ/RimL family protein N-acetyltransferase
MEERFTVTTPKHHVVLYQFLPCDAPAIFSLIDENREHLSKYNEPTAEKYPDVLSVRKSIERPVDPRRLRFGIWARGVIVGSINVTPELSDRRSAAIGYWLAQEHTGLGYASTAVRGLTKYAFDRMGCDRLSAHVDRGNLPSLNLLERVSFKRVFEEGKTLVLGLRYAEWRTL